MFSSGLKVARRLLFGDSHFGRIGDLKSRNTRSPEGRSPEVNEDPCLCQQGHVVQSDDDKCQVDSTFQVRANHKYE
jgi:hypothetical protein